MRKFYVIGIAMLAMFAFSAVVASSASAEGPWWIVLLGTVLHKLEKLELEKVLGKNDEGPFILAGLTNIECTGMTYTGNLIGNNPGLNSEALVFTTCHVQGTANCLAGNGGAEDTISVSVLSALTYWDNGGTEVLSLAMVAFFPANKTTGNDLFTSFTLKNAAGTTACGLLNGTVVEVLATGTNVGSVGELTDKETINKKCGVLGEIGLLNASKVFEEAASGEEKLEGALNTENTVTTAFLLNEGVTEDKSVLIECKLQAFNMAAEELGIVTSDLESGNEFGWESD
jgi:hypothetical protein